MTNLTNNPTLVLGATGKTGARVARKLRERGVAVRTAARQNADIRFDWDDPSSFAGAVQGVNAVYLVSPILRVDFAAVVRQFLDEAQLAGVRHVTYLSAYGIEQAPPQVAMRAVELDLASRPSLTHSILRPAWFMENFSETFLKPVNDEIAAPFGVGAEAFVSTEDIAEVAATTLSDPAGHAGRAYAPTGPEALSFEQAAAHLSAAVGRRIVYRDIDREAWIRAIVRSGVPAEYGAVLRMLTETIASGHGSQANGDVLAATGKAPTRFGAFAAATAAAWR